jgi:hypothetical protein
LWSFIERVASKWKLVLVELYRKKDRIILREGGISGPCWAVLWAAVDDGEAFPCPELWKRGKQTHTHMVNQEKFHHKKGPK